MNRRNGGVETSLQPVFDLVEAGLRAGLVLLCRMDGPDAETAVAALAIGAGEPEGLQIDEARVGIRQKSAMHVADISAATAFTAIRWRADERSSTGRAAADLAARNWFIGNPQGHGEERSSTQIPFPCTGPLYRGRLRHEIEAAPEARCRCTLTRT